MRSLQDRIWDHKSQFKRWMNGKITLKCSIYPYFKEYGIDNFSFFQIEEFPFIDKTNQFQIEQEYILKYDCINEQKAYRSEEEKKEYLKQYQIENKQKIKERKKQYRIENKEKIREKQKQYRIEKKEKLNEISKQYYAENKEKLKETNKQYYVENKEYKNRKICCMLCKEEISIRSLKEHIRRKHQ